MFEINHFCKVHVYDILLDILCIMPIANRIASSAMNSIASIPNGNRVHSSVAVGRKDSTAGTSVLVITDLI